MTDDTQSENPSQPPRLHAFVFPGQGSQYVGMGAALLERSPEAVAVMARADAALGFPLSRLIAEGPADELDLTVNAQPAILATSIAYLEALRPRRPRPASSSARNRWPATRPGSTPPPSPPTRSTSRPPCSSSANEGGSCRSAA